MKGCMTLIRLVARPMLASTFVYGGVQALRNAPALAEAAKPVNDEIRDLADKVAPKVNVPADDKTLVRINAAVHIVAGLGLATGRAPRLSALALAATVVPTTLAGHAFWEEKDKARRTQQMTHFFKNVSMLGGLRDRRRRHRGPARCRVAGQEGSQHRPARGQAPAARGQGAGEAGRQERDVLTPGRGRYPRAR